MAKHQLTHAEEVYFGDAYYALYAKNTEGRRGIQIAANLWAVRFGAVVTADADGVCASQSITAASTGTINGALASGGVATFDVPRNIQAAWTNTAVMTVTGTDEYGEVLVESSASGTSMTGKKAFKTVTAVDVSANVTGATVGSNDVLGLPFRIDGKGDVLVASADGVAESATIVAGVTTTATATTGDVRGTIDFNTAADGTAELSCLIVRNDPTSKELVFGVAQYGG